MLISIAGPTGIPIIGNVHQIDRRIPIYKLFTDWALKYGPIFSLRLGPNRFLCNT